MSETNQILWKICDRSKLKVTTWKDEAVIFNKMIGDTHYVSPIGLELLTLLEKKPRSAQQIKSCDPFDSYDIELGDVENLLFELRKLDIIEMDS